jgi:glycosyltransferase involved in cell wall biosynthesis
MNCLVLTPHRYGIKEVAERVGREWEAQGHSVEYRLPDGAAARIGGVTVGVPGIARWWQKRFRELSETGDEYDLIWAHQPLSPTVPDGAFWDRTIVTFHTTEIAEYRLARNGVYSWQRIPYLWATSRLERWFYGRLQSMGADGPTYTVVSPHLRDEIASFGVDDAAYVPNGLAVPDGDFEPIREAFGIPADATVLFNIGSHTPQKRPVHCARVLNELCEAMPEVHAVIAGDGPLHDAVVTEATNERVHVRGYVSDQEKWRWFAAADVFVSLSAYEGMPVAALEALSFDVPVVLSDIPAHRTILEQHEAGVAVVDGTTPTVRTAVADLDGVPFEASLPSWGQVAERYLSVHAEASGGTEARQQEQPAPESETQA